MTITSISVFSRMYSACYKTFSNPHHAAVFAVLALGSALSSSFRIGLAVAPLLIGMPWITRPLMATEIGQKVISKLSNPSAALTDTIDKVVQKVGSQCQLLRMPSPVIGSLALPLVEEAIFRVGAQQVATAALGPVSGIALSAYTFALAHERARFAPILVGGLALGILTAKVSLVASIAAHMANNAFWDSFMGLAHPQHRGLVFNFLYPDS